MFAVIARFLGGMQDDLDLPQACLSVMVIGDKFCICKSISTFSERAAQNEPDPGNILFAVDASHILTICAAGFCKTGGMAVIDPDDAFWIEQFGCKQVFGSELKIYGRFVDVAQRKNLFHVPVALGIDLTKQQTTGFDVLTLVGIFSECVLCCSTKSDLRCVICCELHPENNLSFSLISAFALLELVMIV